MAIGVPFAVATAIYLNEVQRVRVADGPDRGHRHERHPVGGGRDLHLLDADPDPRPQLLGFAASLALVVILLPSVTRVVEEVLRVVPSGLREASQALGAPEWRTVWSVVLPTARSGVVTAVLLGVARIVGETAPLIFTAFGSQVLNWNPFAHDQGALPLVIWSDVRQAQPVLIDLAFQAAFVLMAHGADPLRPGPDLQPAQRRRGSGRRGSAPAEDDFMARIFVPTPIEERQAPR